MAKKLSKSWFKTRAEGRSAKRQSAECKMPTNQLEPRLKVDRVGNKKGHAGSACVGVCGCVGVCMLNYLCPHDNNNSNHNNKKQ